MPRRSVARAPFATGNGATGRAPRRSRRAYRPPRRTRAGSGGLEDPWRPDSSGRCARWPADPARRLRIVGDGRHRPDAGRGRRSDRQHRRRHRHRAGRRRRHHRPAKGGADGADGVPAQLGQPHRALRRRVLANGGTVVGTGPGAGNSSSTAEIWDPATGTWSAAATAARIGRTTRRRCCCPAAPCSPAAVGCPALRTPQRRGLHDLGNSWKPRPLRGRRRGCAPEWGNIEAVPGGSAIGRLRTVTATWTHALAS